MTRPFEVLERSAGDDLRAATAIAAVLLASIALDVGPRAAEGVAGSAPVEIVGVVSDDAGEPLEGVSVLAAPAGFGAAPFGAVGPPRRPARVSQSVTGPDGRFSIVAAEGSRFTLYARHRSYAATLVEGVVPGVPARIVLGPGDDLRGTVYDRASTGPVVAARVEAAPLGADDFAGTPFEKIASRIAETGEDGEFRIEGLAEGIYELTAVAEGYASVVVQHVAGAAGAAGEPLRMYLERGVRLSGRVVSPSGEVVPDARIRILPADLSPQLMRRRGGIAGSFARASTTADVDGTFVIDGLPSLPGFSIEVSHRDYATVWIEVPSDDDTSRLENLRLRIGRGGSVVAKVLQGDGSPFSGEVTAEYESRAGGNLSRWMTRRTEPGPDSISLTDGVLTIERLPAGEGSLAIRPAGLAEVTIEGVRIVEGQRAELGEIVLPGGPTIHGVVRDDAGKPLAGAIVVARSGSGPGARNVARSDGAGRFAIGGLEADVSHSLIVRVDGFAPAELEDVLAGGQPIVVVPERLGRVVGRVMAGQPPTPLIGYRVEGFTRGRGEARGALRQRGMRGGAPVRAETIARAPSGRFELELEPGSYTVRIDAGGYVPVRIPDVEVRAGEDVAVGDHVLERGISVRGVVVDRETGAPVPNAAVNLDRTGGGGFRWRPPGAAGESLATGPDGRFVARGQWPGVVEVQVEGDRHAPWSGRLTLEAGVEPSPMRIELGRGGSIEGIVRDPETGVVSTGAFVVANSLAAPGGGSVSITDASGMFRFEHLAPETYRVIARPMPEANGRRGFAAMLDRVQTQEVSVAEGQIVFVQFPPSESGLPVSGTVRRGSVPIEARLFWTPDDAAGSRGGRFAVTRSGSDGRFDVLLDNPGRYDVRVVPVAGEGQRPFASGTSYAVSADVSEAGATDLDLVVGESSVSGRVYGAGDAAPLPGVTVLAVTPGDSLPAAETRSDEDGSYRIDGLVPGDYELWYSRRGYFIDSRDEVSVGTDEEIEDLDVMLLEAPSVLISVVDAGGLPIEGALVVPIGGRLPSRTTDIDGFAVLDVVPRGPFEVGVVARGHGPKVLSVAAPGSDAVDFVARLETGPPLVIRLVDREEVPVESARVSIEEDGGSDLSFVLTSFLTRSGASLESDAAGEVRISALAPGRYIVRVESSSGSGRKTLDLEGKPLEVEIGLR